MKGVRRCRPEAKKCTRHKRTEAQRRESFRQVMGDGRKVVGVDDLVLGLSVCERRGGPGGIGTTFGT